VNTPAQAGYYMPAEWEKHEGTWLQWPHDHTFPDHQMRLEYLWLAMAQALHQHEIVHVVVTDEPGRDHLFHQIRYYGLDEARFDLHLIPSDDFWVRDNGPIFVVNDGGELAITAWNFNGWGERFAYEKDRQVPVRVAERLSLPLFTGPITLEGGGIEVNGNGTLMATRTSMVNPNRNPGLGQEEVEEVLKQYLGIEHVIWLSGAPRDFCDGIGDDTDFHIDGAARFVDGATVLYSWTDDQTEPTYPYLKRHLEELKEATSESGHPLTLVPLPLPKNRMVAMQNLSARPPFEARPSLGVYANFYVANGVVLVPVYGDVLDARAKGIIAEHFPGRDIVGLPAQATAELGGMIHCVTQQQPAVLPKMAA